MTSNDQWSLETAGTLAVKTKLDGAAFTITGEAGYSGAGKEWSQSGALPGTYTITYTAVSGYRTPDPQTRTLSAGTTTTFTATYVSSERPVGSIAVSVNLPEALYRITGPAEYSGSGMAWSQGEAPAGT